MGWSSYLGDCRRHGFTPNRSRLPLGLMWKREIGEYVWGSPAIRDGTVYVPGKDVWCFDLDTGEVRWRADGVRAFGATCPTAAGDRLFVCATDALYCLDTNSGKTIYTVLPGSRDSSACVLGDLVIWAGVDGGVHSARADSGRTAWQVPAGFEDAIRFTPSSDGRLLFYADYKGVHARRVESGECAWDCEYGSGLQEPVGTAAVLDELLLVAVKNVGLIALEKASGREKWMRKTEHGPFTGPGVHEAEGIAYVASGKLHALSIEDGREIWSSGKFGFVTSNPIVVGEHIFIGGGHDRRVYGFNRADGTKTWEHEVGDLVFSTPAYADDRLVIGCHDGFVYCFAGANA